MTISTSDLTAPEEPIAFKTREVDLPKPEIIEQCKQAIERTKITMALDEDSSEKVRSLSKFTSECKNVENQETCVLDRKVCGGA